MENEAEDLTLDSSLNDDEAENEARKVPITYARRNGILVVGETEDHFDVYCRPDVKPHVVSELRRYLRQPLYLQVLPVDEFDRTLQQAYEEETSQAMQMAGDLGEEFDLQSVAQELAEPEDLLEAEDDAPIIRLINAMLTEAVKKNASDIHIEPFENRLTVRFRVDGVLQQVLEPKRALAPLLVSRIKVMAKLDIAEKRLPQDGRISLRVAGRAVDVRVSTIPCGHGERVVLRLLDKQAGRLDLEHLGMAPQSFEIMKRVTSRPHGIILVTGPTGSGKTTSLYAVLSRLNDRSRNIMTVEDPIEYYLDGVAQTNVNTKVDMTFARGLRAILRQDPDVVMVGEIRDLETAEIAFLASLTGHLVMSTLHTNTAIGAVTRLRDMGVESFLLASSLLGVVAQRLVRVLCEVCKEEIVPNETDCKWLGVTPQELPKAYRATGCSHCNYNGYRGRTGIYEVIELDEKLRNMIHDGEGELTLEAHARKLFPSIREDGLRRIRNGVTTIEEVLRVTQEQ